MIKKFFVGLNLLILILNLALLFSFSYEFPRFKFSSGYFKIDSSKTIFKFIIALIFINFLNFILSFVIDGILSSLFLKLNLLINFFFLSYFLISKLGILL